MSRKTFFCVDAHTCGNPVRVVAGGGPNLIGANMSEKRQHFLNEYDWIRKGLMFEPRGHDMMSGSILFPSHSTENDFAILFIETSGCLPMCGHGTIGTITIAIEEGLVTPKIPGKINMEAPAGLVKIEYGQTGKKVDWVRLINVKSYLAATGLTIDCPELGEITFDVAYGGNYYAIVDPQQNFSGVHDFTASKIIQYSQVVRERINEKYPDMFIHPENDTFRDVTHMLWTGDPIDPTSSGRNA
ncbi:MAG: 4-hydroxyproline epimerase, partial [Urechidicola sp.]|nr:4-hydroxyproline epimerase [Urechidicola sp.]